MDPITELLMQLFGTGVNPETMKLQKQIDPNYLQNILEMLNIPHEALAASGGAYDYAAFQPTEEWENVAMPTAPSSPLLDAYLADGQDTAEGILAGYIDAGVAPATAVARLAENTGNTDEKAIERWRSLAGDLFNERAAFNADMTSYNAELAKLPVDENGQPVSRRLVSSTPSRAAQPYIDAGLPLPTEQFTQDSFRQYDTSRLDSATASRDQARSAEVELREVLERLRSQPTGSGWGSATPTPTALQPASLEAMLAGDRQGHVLPVPQPSPMVGDRQGHMFPTPQVTPQHGRQGYALGQVPTPVEPTLLSLPASGGFAGGGGGGGGGGSFSPQTVDPQPPIPNAWADFMNTLTNKRQAKEAESAALRKVQGAYATTQKARAKQAGEKSDARYDDIYSRKMASLHADAGKTPLSETLLRRLMGG